MSLSDRYSSPDTLPKELPLFPLRGVILLPGATLPLNIFEPRYLALFDDALARDRILGIIQPERDADPVESPKGRDVALRTVGCAGRITAFQELDDGRMFVTITGIARFRIGAEHDGQTPYRVFDVDYGKFYADFLRNTTEETIDRDQLFSVLKAYFAAGGMNADWKAIEQAPTAQVVNTLSVVTPFGPEEKQALLEAPTLKDRVETLIALAEMAIAGGDDGEGTTFQ